MPVPERNIIASIIAAIMCNMTMRFMLFPPYMVAAVQYDFVRRSFAQFLY